jgi:hypothetical protein
MYVIINRKDKNGERHRGPTTGGCFCDSKLSLKSKTFTIRGGGGERLLIWKSSKSRAVGVTTGKHHVQQENEK